jgi:hypothetical protein
VVGGAGQLVLFFHGKPSKGFLVVCVSLNLCQIAQSDLPQNKHTLLQLKMPAFS